MEKVDRWLIVRFDGACWTGEIDGFSRTRRSYFYSRTSAGTQKDALLHLGYDCYVEEATPEFRKVG